MSDASMEDAARIDRVLHLVNETRLAGTAEVSGIDPDFIVLVDRDAHGRVIRMTGYSPERALRQGLLLIREAIRREPRLRDTAWPGRLKAEGGP
jgi:PAS domain-containing protein